VNPAAVATAFRAVAVAEALSWIGLLAGMYVKRVLGTSEIGVQAFGPIHGGIFVAYVVLAVIASRVLGWSRGTTLVALAAAVPPLVTVWFERWATRTGRLAARAAEAAGAAGR
jgi:integral membrane protein